MKTLSQRRRLPSIRPQTRGDWQTLGGFLLYAVIGIAGAAGLWFWLHARAERRARDWVRVAARVEETRHRVVGQVGSQRGAGMLYSVEVLARYPVNGVDRKSWVALPGPKGEAEAQESRLAGKVCEVLWNPVAADEVVAECR